MFLGEFGYGERSCRVRLLWCGRCYERSWFWKCDVVFVVYWLSFGGCGMWIVGLRVYLDDLWRVKWLFLLIKSLIISVGGGGGKSVVGRGEVFFLSLMNLLMGVKVL